MDLHEIFGQVPRGKANRALSDNLADNLMRLAKIIGHDAVFGTEYWGKLMIDGNEHFITLKREPMSLVKTSQFLTFFRDETEAENKEYEKQVRRRR